MILTVDHQREAGALGVSKGSLAVQKNLFVSGYIFSCIFMLHCNGQSVLTFVGMIFGGTGN